MDLESKRRVVLPLRPHVSVMGFFRGLECPKVHIFPIMPNRSLPLSGPEIPCAHEAGGAVASRLPLVVAVLLRRHVSQIAQPVVRRVAVDVVNVAARPDAVDVEPSKPVFAVLPPQQAYGAVSLRQRDKSSLPPSHRKLIARDTVCKNAGVRVVMQNFFQVVLRDCRFGFSHIIAPYKQWFGMGADVADNYIGPQLIIRGIR